MTHNAENGLRDAEVLALMRLLAPVVEQRRHHGLNIEDAEVYARTVLEAGYRLTEACAACQGSGLYPNPTGVFYAPTEWLGCPDCMGAGRVLPPGSGDVS